MKDIKLLKCQLIYDMDSLSKSDHLDHTILIQY